MYQQSPMVKALSVHDDSKALKEHWNSELEKYLASPMDSDEDSQIFEHLKFTEFMSLFVCRAKLGWKTKEKQWWVDNLNFCISRRRNVDETITRLLDVPFSNTEAWALRLLLLHLPVPHTNANGVPARSVNNYCLRNETFMGAAIRLGLFEHGHKAKIVFQEAHEAMRLPGELKWLLSSLMLNEHFVNSVLHYDQGNPHKANLNTLTLDNRDLTTIEMKYQSIL
eukprot:2159509-Rhodomonas_salina.1